MALPIPSRSGPAAGTVRKKTIFQKTATPVGKLESGNHKSMSISSFKHESPTSPGSVSATTESQRAAGRSEGVMVIDDPVDFLYEASPKARIPTSTKYLPVHADRPRPSILTRNPVPSTSSTGLVSGVSGLTVQDRDEAQERTALATRSTLGPPPAKNPDNPQLIENAHMLGLEQPSTTSQSMSTTPQIQIKTGTKSLVQPRHTPHPALLPYWINARHTNDVTKPDVWTLASTGHLLTNRARRRAYTPSYPALESDIPPPITASKRRKFIAVPLKQELSSLPSLSQLSREDLEVLGRRPPSPMYFKVGEWIREKKDAMVLEDGGFD
ncbi:hypothetical protein CPB83DRAFT_861964 [Crepidotus variabilis]|uniref:Uncharacterized protein n=1 Tax=Crepidotus variabilis TaxID=179855 RepID=A0A9P6E804_9AGAR|nr:hypothetical protein CPB83DRAFT_861964 [Crepidotus variabilis]